MNGAKILVACLKEAGIQRAYGLIGTTVVGFLDGFYEEKGLRYISTRHEQVAGGMADVEGRIRGRPAACILHAGPGLLQAAIAIGDAYKDSSPTLFIAGTVRRRLRGRDGFVEIDAEKVFQTLTQGFYRAESASEIPGAFAQAYAATLKDGGGPAILEVPEDVWQEEGEAPPLSLEIPKALLPAEESVSRAAALFASSSRRALLLGAGAKGIEEEALLDFARKHKLPIITTVNGRGLVDEDDPLVFGPCGFAAQNPPADRVFQTADFLLCLGCTVSDMTSYQYTSPFPKEIVIVNVCEKAVSVFPEKALFVQGDAKAFFSQFCAMVNDSQQSEDWWKELEEERRKWKKTLSGLAVEKTPLSGSYVLSKLQPMLPRNAAYAGGAGIHVTYAMHFLPVHQRNSFFMAHNFGAMGFCFAAALGAKVVMPERPVLCVIGDGDFMMTLQDIETAVREKIDALILVINDFSYRALTATQKMMFAGHVFGSTHGNPNFAQLAESFQARGYTIREPKEVVPTLERALSEKGVRVVDVQIDPNDPTPLNFEAVLRLKTA